MCNPPKAAGFTKTEGTPRRAKAERKCCVAEMRAVATRDTRPQEVVFPRLRETVLDSRRGDFRGSATAPSRLPGWTPPTTRRSRRTSVVSPTPWTHRSTPRSGTGERSGSRRCLLLGSAGRRSEGCSGLLPGRLSRRAALRRASLRSGAARPWVRTSSARPRLRARGPLHRTARAARSSRKVRRRVSDARRRTCSRRYTPTARRCATRGPIVCASGSRTER